MYRSSDKNEIKGNKPEWINRLYPIVMIAIIYLVFFALDIGCPIKFFTGISCPGCGMTRAVWSAVRLRFSEAFYYHPLFGLVPIMFVLYIFGYKIKTRYVKYIWAVIITLFLLVYIIRLLFYPNNIVLIDISNGFMLKFIQNKILGG